MLGLVVCLEEKGAGVKALPEVVSDCFSISQEVRVLVLLGTSAVRKPLGFL